MSDSESDIGNWRKNTISPRDSSKRSHLNESIVEEPVLKKQKLSHKETDQETVNYMTQPPMLLFKHFLNQQEDNILVEDAMRKYNEYKETFACEQLQSFFEAHKDEEWFMEKYHPDYIEVREIRRLEFIESRRKMFIWLYEHGYMDEVSVHINCQDSLVKLLDSAVILLEGGNENDLKVLERKIYRSDSPGRTEIKIDMKVKPDPNSLKWDDFHTSSAEEDSDVEITCDKRLDNAKNHHDSNQEDPVNEETREEKLQQQEEEIIPELPKKELTPEVATPDECVTDEMLVETINPRPLHKNCSIFLRNIHPKVFQSQIEELVKPFPGYMRMALQDPMPERNFLRRGWVTFERTCDIKDVAWQLSKAKLLDVDLGAVINKEIQQRVRPTDAVTNHRAVMRQDVKFAAKLVAKFDKRRHLWEVEVDNSNPLLRNITEHLVDEGSYEEEAYLGGDISHNLAITGGGDPANLRLDEDRELARVLDRLLLYLRLVHSFDYYSATEYDIEDGLPNRCGLIHARGNPVDPDRSLSQTELERHMKLFETKAELVLDSIDNLDFAVASRLGVKSIDEAVEKFISNNTKEISTEKWLCPLSGKKFKGPDYVRKHILNKFSDRIDNVKQTVQFFNNYILDPRRPQLPEHPSNRPTKHSSVCGGLNPAPGSLAVAANYHSNESSGRRYSSEYCSNPHTASREENSYRKSGRSDFGNNRGSSNTGGGSYYSRKIMNYNDISVAD